MPPFLPAALKKPVREKHRWNQSIIRARGTMFLPIVYAKAHWAIWKILLSHCHGAILSWDSLPSTRYKIINTDSANRERAAIPVVYQGICQRRCFDRLGGEYQWLFSIFNPLIRATLIYAHFIRIIFAAILLVFHVIICRIRKLP